MTTNKANILADVGAVLATIVGAPTYHQTVVTVLDEFRTYDQFGAAQLPALCYFSAKGGLPPPVYGLFDQPQKSLDIVVIGHVVATTQTERNTRLGELEEDVRRALMTDPTRDGWAVDTIQIEDQDDDTGVPNKEGLRGNTGTAQWRFRSTYFPNDS